MSASARWHIYVLRCRDGSLYTGITTDVARRVAEHEEGKLGAKYLRGRGPFNVVLEMEVEDRGLASRIEHRIKRLSKREKERLLRSAARRRTLLSEAAMTCSSVNPERARPVGRAAGARP